MKKYAILCVAAILLLASCKKDRLPSLFTADNLTSTFITLDTDSSITLKTPKGAIIKIDPNSFDHPKGTKVKVEVKEAYSVNDILLAGLSTTSNGRLLQSGGMLYFNATADGKNIGILKPIHVSIPTKNYDSSMQLFKGDVQKDSTINWVDPQPLASEVSDSEKIDSSKMDSTQTESEIVEDVPMNVMSVPALADPCDGYDTAYVSIPDTIQAFAENNYIPPTGIADPSVSLYSFDINTCGWYNIDCFIDANKNLVSTVHLTATVNNLPDSGSTEVYICIPSRKLLSDERGNIGNSYTFFDVTNDSIQLILNDKAFIVAVGGTNTKPFYGVTPFTVGAQQMISVDMKQSTREEINRSIVDNKLDQVPIDPTLPASDTTGKQMVLVSKCSFLK